jgi:hypothetical protein
LLEKLEYVEQRGYICFTEKNGTSSVKPLFGMCWGNYSISILQIKKGDTDMNEYEVFIEDINSCGGE